MTLKDNRNYDEKYLEFRDKTIKIFEEYPQIEPLRYYIFRELLNEGHKVSCLNFVKMIVKSFVNSKYNPIPDKAEIIIWIEKPIHVVLETLLPIYEKLQTKKLRPWL